MTVKEREAIETLIKSQTLTQAAANLGVPVNTLSQRVIRIKLKAKRYELWLKEFERYKLQIPAKYVG